MMSSQWMNKYAIMRDLSMAQGCVPVDLAGTVKAGDKPPSQNLIEETEEELFQSWVGGTGDFAAPDLGLIKHMLEEVRNQDATNENENFEKVVINKVIQISKLNPYCPEFKPQQAIATPKGVVKEIPPKNKKKDRNVAVQSLLQNMVNNATNPTTDKDTVNPNNIKKTETTEKVTSWLETPKPPVCIKRSNNTLQLNLDPSSMFKKKNVIVDAAKPVKEVKSTSQYNYAKYVPSNNVDEYYKQFLECSRMKQIVQDDVWTKVERKMKEIDERRAAEAELFALSLALCREEGGAPPEPRAKDRIKQILDEVFLSVHRHSLPGPCRVCELRDSLSRPRELTVPLYDVCDRSDLTEDKTSDEEHSISFKDTLENVNDSTNVDDNLSDFGEKTSDEEHSQNFKDILWNVNLINNDHVNFHNMSDNNNVKENDEQNSQSFEEIQNNLNVKEFNSNEEVKETSNTETLRNVTKSIVDEHIRNWKSKPVDDKTNSLANKNSDNVNKSNIQITTEPKTSENCMLYDDNDEIDAWKFEVLGDDGDDQNEFYDCEQVYESSKVFNVNQSSQTYDVGNVNVTVDAVDNNVEKWRNLAQDGEDIEHIATNNNTSYEFEITKAKPDKLHDIQAKVGSALNRRLQKLLQCKASRFDYVVTKKYDDDQNGNDSDNDDSKLVSCEALEALENLSDSDDSDRTNKILH